MNGQAGAPSNGRAGERLRPVCASLLPVRCAGCTLAEPGFLLCACPDASLAPGAAAASTTPLRAPVLPSEPHCGDPRVASRAKGPTPPSLWGGHPAAAGVRGRTAGPPAAWPEDRSRTCEDANEAARGLWGEDKARWW